MLLVAFQSQEKISYPHLQQVWAHMASMGCKYCLFRERGYFIGRPLDRSNRLRALANVICEILLLGIDICRLALHRLWHRHDLVIAMDNFAFVVAARLFPKVILWSHDFLTDDEAHSKSLPQRLIKRGVRSALKQHQALIIQDRDRLSLFCRTYLGEESNAELSVFLLPVSLSPLPSVPFAPPRTRPVLMQVGGINAWRSHSDLLLNDFQTKHRHYDLALHGFFDAVMLRAVAKAEFPPWASTMPMAPDDVHRIVRKCDIGFIAYNASNLNFFHVAYASGQLAEFLRCGKPIIALGRSSLGEFVESKGLGKHIADIGGLTEAIQQISANYAKYAENCRLAFSESHDLSRYLPELTRWLGNAVGTPA